MKDVFFLPTGEQFSFCLLLTPALPDRLDHRRLPGDGCQGGGEVGVALRMPYHGRLAGKGRQRIHRGASTHAPSSTMTRTTTTTPTRTTTKKTTALSVAFSSFSFPTGEKTSESATRRQGIDRDPIGSGQHTYGGTALAEGAERCGSFFRMSGGGLRFFFFFSLFVRFLFSFFLFSSDGIFSGCLPVPGAQRGGRIENGLVGGEEGMQNPHRR